MEVEGLVQAMQKEDLTSDEYKDMLAKFQVINIDLLGIIIWKLYLEIEKVLNVPLFKIEKVW